jgi:hypothetical protein
MSDQIIPRTPALHTRFAVWLTGEGDDFPRRLDRNQVEHPQAGREPVRTVALFATSRLRTSSHVTLCTLTMVQFYGGRSQHGRPNTGRLKWIKCVNSIAPPVSGIPLTRNYPTTG